MKYKKIIELPDDVKKLPQGAQFLFMAAFNTAFEGEFKDKEAESSKKAWESVEKIYEKNDKGVWVKKMSAVKTYDLVIPIFKSGKWKGVNMKEAEFFSVDRITNFVDNSNAAIAAGEIEPYLKLGHNEKQQLLKNSGLVTDDGQPAIGWVKKLMKVGKVVYAYVEGVPQMIYKLFQSGAYKKVSVEYLSHFKRGVDMVLRAVGLLGAEQPAVENLGDILALYSTFDFVANEKDKATELVFAFSINSTGEQPDNIDDGDKKGGDKNMKTAEELLKDIETKDAQILKMSTDKTTSEAEIAKLKSENETAKKNMQVITIDGLIEGWVKEGKLLPAQTEAIKTFMLSVNLDNVVKFGKDQADKPLKDVLSEYFKSMPQIIKFSEKTTIDGKENAEGDDQEHMTHKALLKNVKVFMVERKIVDITVGIDAYLKEHPEINGEAEK